MIIQSLLLGAGTLVALTAVVCASMPTRHVKQSFVFFGTPQM
jgi:hypothetical protein